MKLNRLFYFLIVIIFTSCVSTNTTYTVDYEKEHTPQQNFEISNPEALELCKNGWFIINELNDSFYMKNVTSKMTETDKTVYYEEKFNNALQYFDESNTIEENYWSYRGIAELHSIWKSQSHYYQDNNPHDKIIIDNFLKAYQLKPDEYIYDKILSSVKLLKKEDEAIPVYDFLLSIEKNDDKKIVLYLQKGGIYKNNENPQKAYQEFKHAYDISTDIDYMEKSYSEMSNVLNDDALVDKLLKNEKNNNKSAFLYYEKALFILNSKNYIEAYNIFIKSKNLATDEKIIRKIEYELSKMSDDYQRNNTEFYKKLIVANKAGFKTDAEYKAYLGRIDFENLYKSLNLGLKLEYLPGDVIVAPSQRLSITDVELTKDGYVYLVTGYGQNQLSKCCMIISDYQLQYVSWYGEGLITEQLLLVYQGKSTYKQGFTIVDCDVFTVANPYSPYIQELSERINESVKFDKWDFDYILEKLTAAEYQVLIDNNYVFALHPVSYQKLCYACTSELIDASNKKEPANYKGWKKVFDYILSSPFEISNNDYWWLCETFNASDEFNSYLEKYIDIPGVDSKWFHDSYLYEKKNFNTVISHLKDAKKDSNNYWFYLSLYGINDEKIIKELIQKGLDCSLLNPSNDYLSYLDRFIGHQTPKTIQLLIEHGLDINMFFPYWGEEGATLLKALTEEYNQEERVGDPHYIKKETIDFLIKKGAHE